MEQLFLNESLKFYCRTTKTNKPTPVYAYLNICNRTTVIPVKAKVIPSQFNVKAQKAIISNLQSELDNRNNEIANSLMKAFRSKYDEFVSYLKNNPDEIGKVSEIIHNFVGMKKETKNTFRDTIEYILYNELETEIKEHKITEAWAVTKRSNIKKFIDFLSLKKLPNLFSVLDNKTYNIYKDYLLNEFKVNGKALKISAINQNLSSLKSLVNAINERDILPYVETGRWKSVDNRLTIDEKKSSNIVFEETDLQKIMDLKLSGTEEIIRDIFVFGCQVGQRPADCIRILRGECKKMVSNGIEVISILPHKTRKTDKYAFIPIFCPDVVNGLMEKFSTIDEYKEFLNKTDNQRNTLNSKYMKSIFKKAGFDDEVEVTEQRGTEIVTVVKKRNETAHIYLARHYFITLCFRSGLPAEKVIEITGHTTTKQVNETYSHLSVEQKADRLTSGDDIKRLVSTSRATKASKLEARLFFEKPYEVSIEDLSDEEIEEIKRGSE